MIHINRLGKFSPDDSSKPGLSSKAKASKFSASAANLSNLSASSKLADTLADHPMLGIGIGIGVGLVVGYLLKRR